MYALDSVAAAEGRTHHPA